MTIDRMEFNLLPLKGILQNCKRKNNCANYLVCAFAFNFRAEMQRILSVKIATPSLQTNSIELRGY